MGLAVAALNGLKADCEQRDQHGGEAAYCQDPPGEGCAIGEFLQPFLHREPCQRGRDEDGDGYEFDDICGQHADDGGYGGTEGVADAYFLIAEKLLCFARLRKAFSNDF